MSSAFSEPNIPKILETELQPDALELVDLESNTPSSSHSSLSSSEYEDASTRLDDVNKSLCAIGVSPIDSLKIKKSVRYKYAKAKQAIAKKLNITTGCHLSLTLNRNCKWCSELLESSETISVFNVQTGKTPNSHNVAIEDTYSNSETTLSE